MTPEYKPEPTTVVTDGDTIQIEREVTLAEQYINACESFARETVSFGELAGKFVLNAKTEDYIALRSHMSSLPRNTPFYEQQIKLMSTVFELFAEFGGSV